MSKFLTITALRPQAGVLANRDDTGSAKSLHYGGVVRTRNSSQSTKRHLRQSTSQHALQFGNIQDGYRSKHIFEVIADRLMEQGVPEQRALWMAYWLKTQVLREKAKTANGDDDEQEEKPRAKRGDSAPKVISKESLESKQLIFMGHPEIDYMVSQLVAAAKKGNQQAIEQELVKRFNLDEKVNSLVAIAAGAGITTAVFGRFITSDLLARTDAAVHVAHAFTVHAEEKVDDYFTAVDDQEEEGGGAGHLDQTELTSGLFLYSVVIDVDLLISNLSGDERTAAEVVRRLIMLLATECMAAKKGSTAPYSRASFVLVEAGDEQPRTLAGAFESPMRSKNGWLEPSVQRLDDFLDREHGMYGDEAVMRFYASMATAKLSRARQCTLPNVCKLSSEAVLGKLTEDVVSQHAIKEKK